MHADPHPYAGKTVKLKTGHDYRLEDWWDRNGQGAWLDCIPANVACCKYAARFILLGLPNDNEVVYGKIGPYGHLIHESELDL